MSCGECCQSKPAVCSIKPPEGYKTIQAFCGLAITALALNALPRHFFGAAIIGFVAHHIVPTLSEDMSKTAGACVSGCTDIVGQSYGLKFDSRLSMIIATVFFCCHIEHHAREMVPVVGAALGFRIFHLIKSD